MTSSVASYVQELLYEQDCVVIPDFGGFIAHFLSAGYQSATGVYVPPKKRIAFNEVLKFDDGLLSSYISHRHSISRTEALGIIASFVKEIKETLQAQHKFVFEHLGTFSLNAEGKLLFEPSTDTNYYAEGYGLANLFLYPNKSSQSTLQGIEQAEPVNISLPLIEPVEEVEASVADSEPTRDVIEVIPDYSEEETKEIRFPINSFPWWLAACIAILFVVGFTLYFYRSSQRQEASFGMINPVYGILEKLPFMEATKHGVSLGLAPHPQQYADSALKSLISPALRPYFDHPIALGDQQMNTFEKYNKKDTLASQSSQVVSNAETQPAHTLNKAEPRYYVIAGAFENRHNANNLKRHLALKGYHSVRIIGPAKGEYLFKVAAAGFKSFSRATQETARVSDVTGEEAWILKNRN